MSNSYVSTEGAGFIPTLIFPLSFVCACTKGVAVTEIVVASELQHGVPEAAEELFNEQVLQCLLICLHVKFTRVPVA